jgi:hypothetical protein
MAISRFVNESGTNLNHYILTDKNGASYNITLLRNANITQVGTPLNAQKLNELVDGINAINYSQNGNTLNLTKPDGTTFSYTPSFSDINTTYTLTKSGDTITLTGSDGSSSQVKDDNTTYTLGSFGVNATFTELNYTQGLNSNIQGQLNQKSSKWYYHNIHIKLKDGREDETIELFFSFPSKTRSPYTSYANIANEISNTTGQNSHLKASGWANGQGRTFIIYSVECLVGNLKAKGIMVEMGTTATWDIGSLIYDNPEINIVEDFVGVID